MPSYYNADLPSYYEADFSSLISTVGTDMDWNTARETARETARMASRDQTVVKMRLFEWLVKAIYNIPDSRSYRSSVYAKCTEITKRERDLPKEQQDFGNLLAVLKSRVGLGRKDHEIIESVCKLVMQTGEGAQNTPAYFSLLNII